MKEQEKGEKKSGSLSKEEDEREYSDFLPALGEKKKIKFPREIGKGGGGGGRGRGYYYHICA